MSDLHAGLAAAQICCLGREPAGQGCDGQGTTGGGLGKTWFPKVEGRGGAEVYNTLTDHHHAESVAKLFILVHELYYYNKVSLSGEWLALLDDALS